MEENNEKSLFGLSVDEQAKRFLKESARWGKFLSIVGFIVCILLVVAGIYFATVSSQFTNEFRRYGSNMPFEKLGAAIAIVYIVIAIIYFFPCLYLFKFSNHMSTAMASNDQAQMNEGFMHLKSMFKYVGIFTIIILCLYLLGLVAGLSSGGM
ncbi:MAG: DUF5362 family protein [Chitinophagaceae bacterium]|nr:DUF5362 family protein [Chitinophagaceae bacterium]